MNLIGRVTTFHGFTVHKVLKDFIFVMLDDVGHSAVSDGENASGVASRSVCEGARNSKILQVSNLLLDDIDTAANVT